FGPGGTAGSCGAGPRPEATISQMSVTLSCSQSHGSPVVAFARSVPLTIFDAPVAASATQISIPVSLVLRKDRWLPSGENLTFEIRGCGGSVTLVSAPLVTFLSVIE